MNERSARRVPRRINTRNQTIGFNQLRLYVRDIEDRIITLEDRMDKLDKPIEKVEKKEKVNKPKIDKE